MRTESMEEQKKWNGCLVKRSFEGINTEICKNAEDTNEESPYKVIEGKPIVYDTPTIITENDGFEYIEIIKSGAVQPTAITRDTALYYNHDVVQAKPLARVRTGRLQLTLTEAGVSMRAEINTERSDARDLYLAIKDGDVSKMSFMFRVEEDTWDFDGMIPRRTITKIGYIHEVSAVSDPAYEATSITARSGEPIETITDAVKMARKKAEDHKTLLLERQKALALLELR